MLPLTRRRAGVKNAKTTQAAELHRTQQHITRELERCNVLLADLAPAAGREAVLKEIPRSQLAMQGELGKGTFGVVSRAVWTQPSGRVVTVAAKTLWSGSVEDRASFLVEANIMAVLSHPHLVRVLGAVTEGDSPVLVMELLANGNMKTHLRQIAADAADADADAAPTWMDLVDACVAIADGMSYLASKKYARVCLCVCMSVCSISPLPPFSPPALPHASPFAFTLACGHAVCVQHCASGSRMQECPCWRHARTSKNQRLWHGSLSFIFRLLPNGTPHINTAGFRDVRFFCHQQLMPITSQRCAAPFLFLWSAYDSTTWFWLLRTPCSPQLPFLSLSLSLSLPSTRLLHI